MHHCASFSQQYCQDVKNDENSAIAVCDKNDILEDSVKVHSNQQMRIQKLASVVNGVISAYSSETCYFRLYS